MRQLVWTEFSGDSDTLDVSLLISVRTQSILLSALEYVQKQYVWSGDYDAVDGALGKAIEEIIEQVEGGSMSCIDIAGCIETDETVKSAIEQSIINNGFAPNPETDLNPSPPPTLSSSAKSQNLLPAALDCENDPQIAMGLARAIVKELHESAEDFFEIIEYATNAAEAVAMASEQIPVVGNAVSGALEFMDWVLDTLKETYEASYTQASEDELACLIFCHIMDTCSLSINDLISIYENAGSITIAPPDDIFEVLTFGLEFELDIDTITVAIFHYQILRLISWSSFAGFSAAYLQSLLNNNVSASDYSYEDLCDDCVTEEPTNYWMLYYDFRTGGQQNTATAVVNGSNNDGSFVGNGYEANYHVVATTTNLSFGIADLGAQYVIRGVATRQSRRGSTGNGTHDFASTSQFPNANYGGTGSNFAGNSFITNNENTFDYGSLSASNSFLSRSLRWSNRVNIATNSQNQKKLRVFECVVWGLAGAGNTKPPRAIWAGNTLPATYQELFPDYVAP